jgi:hypothetical protein
MASRRMLLVALEAGGRSVPFLALLLLVVEVPGGDDQARAEDDDPGNALGEHE